MLPNEHQQQRRTARFDWFLLTLLGMSLCGNVIFGVLLIRLAGTSFRSLDAQAFGPPIGTTLPALDAQRVDGKREQLAFGSDGQPTLIYVFSPNCTWCAKNQQNIRAVVAAARKSYRIVAVSLSPDVQQFLATEDLGVPVYVNPSRETFGTYRLGTTPMTIVASPEGKVLKTWLGAYVSTTKKDVESYFGVELPGVLSQTSRVSVPPL